MGTSFLLGYFENCFLHIAKFKVEIFDNLGKHGAVDNNSTLLCSAPESPNLSVSGYQHSYIGKKETLVASFVIISFLPSVLRV